MTINAIDIAKKYLGLEECRDREALIKLFSLAGLRVDPETTPWCAAFVNSIEHLCGREGTGRLNARSFLNYGEEVDIDEAVPGDICVFTRANSPTLGHVAYYYDSVDENTIKVLGGNQGDKVCIENHSLDNLLSVRRCH